MTTTSTRHALVTGSLADFDALSEYARVVIHEHLDPDMVRTILNVRGQRMITPFPITRSPPCSGLLMTVFAAACRRASSQPHARR